MKLIIQYLLNLGIMLSQILSTLLGGDPDESLSGRTGKAARTGKWWFVKVQAPLINRIATLFGDSPNHCERNIELDRGSRQIWDWTK